MIKLQKYKDMTRLELGEIGTKQFRKVGKSGAKMHFSHCGGEGHIKQTRSQRQPKLKVIPDLNSSACLFHLRMHQVEFI